MYERAGQLGIFGDGRRIPTGLAFVDDMSTSVPYRWQTFNTYDNAVGWLAGNDPTLYGGVTPQSWTDGNGTAGNLSADPAVLAALFTHVGYAAGNATIWSKVETQQSSTNGEIAAALFRVKNSTASAIPWTARFYYSSYGSWGESASVAVNGVNVFASSANTLFYQTLTISIPAASTATVVFTSALGPAPAVTPDLAQRAGQLGFWGNSLLLPAGLSFVDDLAAPVPFRWQTFDTFDDATGAWLMGNDPAMYGGVSPAAWTDGGATAGSMSSNPTVLATLFTNQGRASRNALIWSEVETVYSSTNGGIGAALFRVRNTTGSAIVWTPSFNYSCHAAWGEVASVALDGVDVWTSAGPGTLGSQTVGLSIPAGGTSTVIFTSTLGPPGGGGTARARGGQLGIVGDGLVLPAGLVFVDDL